MWLSMLLENKDVHCNDRDACCVFSVSTSAFQRPYHAVNNVCHLFKLKT